MLSNEEYIRHSLELNLFFLRIAKEHAIFGAASLPPRDYDLACQMVSMKDHFEDLLSRAISLSHGVISDEVINSKELVTDLTLQAENSTQFLTGIPINTDITTKELNLVAGSQFSQRPQLLNDVSNLNQDTIIALSTAITSLIDLYNDILSCKSFTYIYPLMLNHVIRESQLYLLMLTKLQNRDGIDSVKEIIEMEINWNRIMGEHAKFIRGYLDPSEVQLFHQANSFANEFDELLERTITLLEMPNLLPEITAESLIHVTSLRNFKEEGTKGILACKVRSVISPLLSDHVTREANHYLRLLRSFSKMS